MKLWEGLGYYSRARNMQKTARIIIEKYGGVFPKDHADIILLPGIGPYTAGAISSICFGEAVPAVDGNVLRVVARLTGDTRDIALSETKKTFAAMLAQIYPQGRSGDFTQSLMELGAVVCLPNSAPKCGICPLCGFCRAFETGRQLELPVKTQKPPRKKKPLRFFSCAVTEKSPCGKDRKGHCWAACGNSQTHAAHWTKMRRRACLHSRA
jgi:A/G-specific adenine glycosylase